MTPAQRTRLIRSLFASEPGHRHAQRRAAELQALATRTTGQESELAFRRQQIADDLEILGKYLAALRADGVNIAGAAWQSLRQSMLANQRTTLQARLDALDERVTEIRALRAVTADPERPLRDGEIDLDSAISEQVHWAGFRSRLEQELDALTEVENLGTTLWQP